MEETLLAADTPTPSARASLSISFGDDGGGNNPRGATGSFSSDALDTADPRGALDGPDRHHSDHIHNTALLCWVKPVPKQTWGPQQLNHRVATGYDLVYDLVFAALIASLGHSFSAEVEDGDVVVGLRDYAAMFLPLFLVWAGIVDLLNKFDEKDVIFRLYFVANLAASAFLGISAEVCGSNVERNGCHAFVRTLAWVKIVQILFRVYLIFHNRHLWISEGCLAAIDGLVGVFFFANSLISIDTCGEFADDCWTPYIVTWWLAIGADFLKMTVVVPSLGSCCVRDKVVVPHNIPLYIERFSCFIILCLGEIVASCVAHELNRSRDGGAAGANNATASAGGETDPDPIDPHVLISLISLATAVLSIAYFDVREHSDVSTLLHGVGHALQRGPVHKGIWVVLHIFLAGSLNIFGNQMEHALAEGNPRIDLIAFALCLIELCFAGFDLLHGGDESNINAKKPVRIAAGVAGGVLHAISWQWFILDWPGSIGTYMIVQDLILAVVVGFGLWAKRRKQP